MNGKHLLVIDITTPRIWETMYNNVTSKDAFKLREDVLQTLLKSNVFLRIPFNSNLGDHRLEKLIDYLLGQKYKIRSHITAQYGEFAQQVHMELS
jgi:hypothetical protein